MDLEKAAIGVFGVVFIVTMLVLATKFKNPTEFQYFVFRVTLAIAVAGIAPFIPGLLQVEVGTAVKAGGAIAVFVIVYFFSPARLVAQPRVRSLEALVHAWRDIRAPNIQNLDADMAHRAYNAMKLQAAYWKEADTEGRRLIRDEGLDPYESWFMALNSVTLQMSNGKSASENLQGELTRTYQEMKAYG